jgi:BCCT family betaine/carnitine transporter
MYKGFMSRIPKLKYSLDNIDWQLFSASSFVLFAMVFVILIFPEWSAEKIDLLYISATKKYGILYIIIAIALLLFLLYVAISKYGNIVLGDPGTAYSTFSWASMLFCAGIGASLIYWGATEWALYYKAPPFATGCFIGGQ